MTQQAPDDRPILEIRGLTTAFRHASGRDVLAVNGVDLTISRGACVGLVGESGSGKSALALSIIRMLPAGGAVTGGSVHFDGRDLLPLPEREMRRIRGARIGFVFQEPMLALNPALTIGHQIAEVLSVHGLASGADAWHRAVALLDMVRIPDARARARDYAHQLSGGMRQRVLIAAAVACQPSLLIADEPTTALDVTIQADILDLLREMRERLGLSLLLITHDLGVVSDLADRLAVMYAGRIVEEGPSRAVLAAPAHPYTRGLLASLPGTTPGARLAAIPGAVPDPAALPRGCAFGPRCPDHDVACDDGPPSPVRLGRDRAVRCIRAAEAR